MPDSNQPIQSVWLCSSGVERRRGCSVQPAGIMERTERDFSRQSLGASSGQLAQLAANHVPLERYHAGEPEQPAQWSMSVQPAPHVAHESHVSQRQETSMGRLWLRSCRRTRWRSWRTAKKRKIIQTEQSVCFRCKMHERIRKPTRDWSGFLYHVCTYIAGR